ncbi:MAG: 16S rRNA (uracil(1498)-N(3))-methyltransferase [Gammaproteobacteria bacterium]|nr:16S rRNA (uracil(1498)-N(3))-methyltransferase [Gammaproteobacteria bacterium]
MAIPRVYVDLPLASGATVELPALASSHVTRVLRLRAGDALTLFNGRGGEYTATLARPVARDHASVKVDTHAAVERESPLALTLLQAIARGERMDLIVQKATELGVARIVPLTTERSVVRLDERQAARRLEHWRAVAIAACEQCGRNRPPQIDAITDFERLADATCGLAPGERSPRLMLEPDAPAALAARAVGLTAATLLVGPEGGWSEREAALARRSGFTACRLGPRVLRTETAPLAALAVLQALAGDLGT